MNAIVCVNQNWQIGREGKLLYHIPEDMEYFKQMTVNKTVVMGRGTLESLPGGKPLRDRVNIVVSGTLEQDDCESFIVCRTPQRVFECVATLGIDSNDVFVIGGQRVYAQFISCCKTAYVTKVEDKIDRGRDGYRVFPNLDVLRNWKLIKQSPRISYNDNITYSFCQYDNSE